jgi:hypothetical protein
MGGTLHRDSRMLGLERWRKDDAYEKEDRKRARGCTGAGEGGMFNLRNNSKQQLTPAPAPAWTIRGGTALVTRLPLHPSLITKPHSPYCQAP